MRPITVLAGFVSLLAAAAPITASPIYYGFEGQVTESSAAGFAVGQQVKYLFLVDQDLPGFAVNAGTVLPVDDIGVPGDLEYYHFFFADYLGGDAMPGDGAGSAAYEQYHHYYGYNQIEFGTFHGQVVGSNLDESGYDFVSVLNDNVQLSDWTEGLAGFTGLNHVHDQEGSEWEVRSDLRLCSVSNFPPAPSVPEPAAAGLMALGLALLGGASLRKRRAA